mmetsp:Transcript_8343/g.15094  ORF Transcript_8343/g.15094 Transcript_8343/m.15094 type:complete len:87 (-) Transcript_8343:15-275(-)
MIAQTVMYVNDKGIPYHDEFCIDIHRCILKTDYLQDQMTMNLGEKESLNDVVHFYRGGTRHRNDSMRKEAFDHSINPLKSILVHNL